MAGAARLALFSRRCLKGAPSSGISSGAFISQNYNASLAHRSLHTGRPSPAMLVPIESPQAAASSRTKQAFAQYSEPVAINENLGGTLSSAMLPTLVTAGASTAIYALLFDFSWAVGMTSLVFVHESGHALAMRYYKLPFSPMIFVPFVGASLALLKDPPDADTNAKIALAGPVVGGLGALACGGLGLVLNSHLLLGLGHFGVLINILNMMPIGPLDGGQIAATLSKWHLLAGWSASLGFLLALPQSSPIFVLTMIFSTWNTFKRFSLPRDAALLNGTPGRQSTILSQYLLCLFVLVAAELIFRRNQSRGKEPQLIVLRNETG